MNRFFYMVLLVPALSFGFQKDLPPHQKTKQISPPQAPVYMLTSLKIHELMANRNLAPHVAWLILWADFKEEFDTLARK